MTPGDLRLWRSSLGLKQHEAAAELGYGLTQYGAMERAHPDRQLPLSVALACAAVVKGIPPYPFCVSLKEQEKADAF